MTPVRTEDEPIKLFNAGPFAWSSRTEFHVQIGKGVKGKYHTKYTFRGDLITAFKYFHAINIGRGYKKRLFSPHMNQRVLARAHS